MLTQNEITSLSLSPTKKDFVQIWNELLDVAGRLSERWDPTSTNESDPGIVILKALAGIADKLNYNIDKNTLEAFMPTASQEDSMRKLCETLGYNIKYYQSALTNVSIKYHNSDPSADESAAMEAGLIIPKFTVITNNDQDVSYFTTNQSPLYISSTSPSVNIVCMEGQIVKCESVNDNNVITANQISENNRFYLPEAYIAENGIFIYNIFNSSVVGGDGLEDGIAWERVDNLNNQVPGSRVYKFGYDSYEGRPYIEFPEDYSELFNEGIFLYYTRTSGASGNVSAKTLTKFELPNGEGWDKVSAESFSAENPVAANSGSNIETIKQAYNNFKKTIGTFETLVTCRDYMNKIYSMLNAVGKPLVSNVLVTDIRNDLNRAVTICSCDGAGIFYKETPIVTDIVDGALVYGETKTEVTESEFKKAREYSNNDYAQVGETKYTTYKVDESQTTDTGFVRTEDPVDYSNYDIVEVITPDEYTDSSDPVEYTEYKQFGDVIEEKTSNESISDPTKITDDIVETYTPSLANMPRWSPEVKTTLYYNYDPDQGPIMGTRYTNWYIGSEDSAHKIYLYADMYGSDWMPEEYINKDPLGLDEENKYFKSHPDNMEFDDEGNYIVDDTIDLGYAEAFGDGNSRLSTWVIHQGDKYFVTNLPIDWVKSTERTIVNEQVKTVTNNIVNTINMQRDAIHKKERTVIQREQRDAIYKEQREIVKKEQRTATKEFLETKTIELEKENYHKEVTTNVQEKVEEHAIDYFDIVLYPFKSYNQIRSNIKDIKGEYEASYTFSPSTFDDVMLQLKKDNINTLAHSFKAPEAGDIVSINNYLRLNATIATNTKVTAEEGDSIVKNIKMALANAFNLRELDFGEEIPFDSILEVIEAADHRIRVASLNDPTLYTTFSVYEGKDNNNIPSIKEYAVKSDWLTHDTASTIKNIDAATDEKGQYIGTYNTEYARNIYNELAARNVLAGRVSLFNYNTTFNNSFKESAYQVTETVSWKDCPTDLQNIHVNSSNPYAVVYDDETDITYTGQFLPDENEIRYQKTYVPKVFLNNKDTEGTSLGTISTIAKNSITDVTTKCDIFGNGGVIEDVKLNRGEFVKFRAPNFKTIKTYPAYVNYHLDLDTEYSAVATNAEAYSIYSLLNEDVSSWSLGGSPIRWQKALQHFKDIDSKSGKSKYVKTFTISKPISGYSPAAELEEDGCDSEANTTGQHVRDAVTGKCTYCGKTVVSNDIKGSIVISADNDNSTEAITDPQTALFTSGCIAMTNDYGWNETVGKNCLKATLTWDTSDGKTGPDDGSTGPDLPILLSFDNPFITSKSILSDIEDAIDERLELLKNQTIAGKTLPEHPWIISFSFEYVPFTSSSMDEWIRLLTSGKLDLGFAPEVENDVVLWRVYGSSYKPGKYILDTETLEGAKLLNFGNNYFTSLDGYTSRLHGVFIAKSLGKDAEPATILNDSERVLGPNEYLYIEYTPSSTTEDGTSQELPPVTEIYGPGTILRPSGFEVGLMDSDAYTKQGTTPHKTVQFETASSGNQSIDMHKFGANEQVEIRDFARVVLDANAFKSKPIIYLYKNFSCHELEKINGKNGNRSYTLKDGEYIFYTDQNKNEFAYFTTGTQVTMRGNVTFDKYEVIDIASIFDNGIESIPWKYKSFADDAAIIFQEYQYITLGADDTVQKLTILKNADHENANKLSSTWQFCDNVEYLIAGSTDPRTLPPIEAYPDDSYYPGNSGSRINRGCGWEACSTLELDVSPDKAQTLRNDDQVQTSLALVSTSPGGYSKSDPLEITPTDADHPISFKTNLNCQTSSDTVNIGDLATNTDKLPGFEFKIFTEELPAIVKTELGKVVPHHTEVTTDYQSWEGVPLAERESTSIWRYIVDLADIQVNAPIDEEDENSEICDYAVRLPVTVIPKTYGVFSIYVEGLDNSVFGNGGRAAKVWLETLPGTKREDISLINGNTVWETPTESNGSDRMLLNYGVNCIRVNKTTKLFVKAAADSVGSLYIDDLKLVKIGVAKYRETPSSEERTTTTQGLNVAQLGYLTPSEITEVDADVLRVFKESYVDEAVTKLRDVETKAQEEFTPEFEKLVDLQDKFTKLSDYLTESLEELETFKENTSEITAGSDAEKSLMSMLSNFRTLQTDLDKERTLLDALNTDSNYEAVEQQLAGLLDSFASLEATKNALLETLLATKTKALSDVAKKVANDAYLEKSIKKAKTSAGGKLNKNTVSGVAGGLDASMREKLKAKSIELVEQHFNEQLVPIMANMSQVADLTERNSLLSTVEALKEMRATDTKAKILSKIKKLVSNSDSATLTGLLDTMLNTALEANYPALSAALVKLYAYLGTKDLASMIAELELVATEGSDTQLLDLIKNITAEFSATNAFSADLTTIGGSDGTGGLIATVAAKHSTTTEVTTITSSIRALYKSVYDNYNKKLKGLVEAIYTAGSEGVEDSGELAALNTLNQAYNDTVEALNASKDAQVADILTAITLLKSSREVYIKCIDLYSTSTGTFATSNANWPSAAVKADYANDFESLPYSAEAVKLVWAEYLTEDFGAQINNIYTNYYDNLIDLESYSELESAKTPPTLLVASSDLPQVKAFESIKEQIESIFYRHKQQSARKALIKDLEKGLIKPAAFNSVSFDGHRLAVIRELLSALKNTSTDVAKKPQLLRDLRTELEQNILIDEQLASAAAQNLCPSILQYKKNLKAEIANSEDDDFYKKLIAKLDSWYKQLTSSGSIQLYRGFVDNIIKAIKENYELNDVAVATAVVEDDEKALKNWLCAQTAADLTKLNSDKTLLSSDVLKILNGIKANAVLQKNIVDIIAEADNIKTWSAADIDTWLTDNAVGENDCKTILAALSTKFGNLKEVVVEDTYRDAYNTIWAENLLLEKIKELDTKKTFYYTATIDPNLAIEFNENEPTLNTLMNPATNYDINNVNNSFVVSKLDIDYLDQGIKIARASRLN